MLKPDSGLTIQDMEHRADTKLFEGQMEMEKERTRREMDTRAALEREVNSLRSNLQMSTMMASKQQGPSDSMAQMSAQMEQQRLHMQMDGLKKDLQQAENRATRAEMEAMQHKDANLKAERSLERTERELKDEVHPNPNPNPNWRTERELKDASFNGQADRALFEAKMTERKDSTKEVSEASATLEKLEKEKTLTRTLEKKLLKMKASFSEKEIEIEKIKSNQVSKVEHKLLTAEHATLKKNVSDLKQNEADMSAQVEEVILEQGFKDLIKAMRYRREKSIRDLLKAWIWNILDYTKQARFLQIRKTLLFKSIQNTFKTRLKGRLQQSFMNWKENRYTVENESHIGMLLSMELLQRCLKIISQVEAARHYNRFRLARVLFTIHRRSLLEKVQDRRTSLKVRCLQTIAYDMVGQVMRRSLERWRKKTWSVDAAKDKGFSLLLSYVTQRRTQSLHHAVNTWRNASEMVSAELMFNYASLLRALKTQSHVAELRGRTYITMLRCMQVHIMACRINPNLKSAS